MFGIDPITLYAASHILASGVVNNSRLNTAKCYPKENAGIEVNFQEMPISRRHNIRQYDMDNIIKRKSKDRTGYIIYENPAMGALAIGNLKIDINTQIGEEKEKKTSKHCIWYKDVEVNIQYNVSTYMAFEIQENECVRDLVRTTTEGYIDQDREIIKSFIPIFKASATAIERRNGVLGPMNNYRVDAVKKQLRRLMKSAVYAKANNIKNKREKLFIDKRPQEISDIERVCKISFEKLISEAAPLIRGDKNTKANPFGNDKDSEKKTLQEPNRFDLDMEPEKDALSAPDLQPDELMLFP